jgi:hypothetical protein
VWAALDSQNERLVEACHPLLRADAPGGHKPRRRWRARAAGQPAQQPRHSGRGSTGLQP